MEKIKKLEHFLECVDVSAWLPTATQRQKEEFIKFFAKRLLKLFTEQEVDYLIEMLEHPIGQSVAAKSTNFKEQLRIALAAFNPRSGPDNQNEAQIIPFPFIVKPKKR